MNETLDDPGQQAGPAQQSAQQSAQNPAPQPPHPHQDLDRLRRSTSNRYIAGVAGGLGRHFDVDPTIIRVLLVVLTFFGGAGLLIYAACWLFVPEDTAEHAPIRVSSEPRKILLLAAAGIAFLLAAGDAFNGFGSGQWWPAISIAVIVAVVLIIRDRRHGDHAAPAPPAAAPFAATATAAGGPSATGAAPLAETAGAPAYSAGTEQTQVLGGDQPPAWEPPVARPPLLPPHPKRTGVVWFWPTLALIAVGLGILGIYDNSHVVVDGAYPALALGITAVMLLVGSVFGRPGGLIFLGFLASIALAGNLVVGGRFGVDAKEIHETPATSAAVLGDYHTTVGDIRLDLSQVSDPQALAGREINVHLRTGSIEVILPRSLNADVDAKLDFAGGIKVPGDDGGGFNHEVHKHLTGSTATNTAPLVLDLDAKLGQITVEYQ